ncbi:MAG: DUF427 domain-containing protein [Cyanobacteria bacterium J06627_8]
MVRAVWNEQLLAESDQCVVVEGNQYFPLDAANMDYFEPSEKTTFCPWKGTAHYYSLNVNGKVNPDAAWYYPNPKEGASQIKGHIAFWRGVTVES